MRYSRHCTSVSVWSAAPRFRHHTKTPSPVVNLLCRGCFAILRQLLCFRRWPSPLCCPGWITVMLLWLAYRPICLIVSSLCSTLLLGRLLDCDDQTTSQTLLPVFTGCVHLNASSLNWQSLSTEVFTAWHCTSVSVWSAALVFRHHIKTPSPVNNSVRSGLEWPGYHLAMWWTAHHKRISVTKITIVVMLIHSEMAAGPCDWWLAGNLTVRHRLNGVQVCVDGTACAVVDLR